MSTSSIRLKRHLVDYVNNSLEICSDINLSLDTIFSENLFSENVTAKFEENCELLGTDNVQGQIS